MAYNTFNDEAVAWLLEKVKTNTSAIAAEIERAKAVESDLQLLVDGVETQLSNI